MQVANKNILPRLSEFLPRLGLAFIFLYFGISSVINPAEFGAAWIMPPFDRLIETVLPINAFMIIFGILQILAAIGAIAGPVKKYSLGLMFLLLLGIIFNLSLSLDIINDIVARDIALSLVALGLFIKEIYANEKV